MTWLFTLLAMAVIALVAGVVTGRITGAMEPAETSLPFRGLPDEHVDPEDLAALKFDAALRGYRMHQVDQVLDRVAEELRTRDDEIARLHAALTALQPDAVRSPYDDTLGPAFTPPGGATYDVADWSDQDRD